MTNVTGPLNVTGLLNKMEGMFGPDAVPDVVPEAVPDLAPVSYTHLTLPTILRV